MSRCLLLLIAMFFGQYASLIGQAPERFSYQATIRDADAKVLNSRNVGVRISIVKDSATGSAVYVEKHLKKTNINGLISLEIGGGIVVSGKFSAIQWGSTTFFIRQDIDVAGGENYGLSVTTPLLSVPYALHAKNAEKSFKHYIGELHEGGVIFDLWKDSSGIEHGLIINKYWLGGDSTVWSNRDDTFSGAFSLTDGYSNSLAIVNTPGHISSAAKICLDLVEEGYDDWYLPSWYELVKLLENIEPVDRVLREGKYDFIQPVTMSYLDAITMFSSTERADDATLFGPVSVYNYLIHRYGPNQPINNLTYVNSIKEFVPYVDRYKYAKAGENSIYLRAIRKF